MRAWRLAAGLLLLLGGFVYTARAEDSASPGVTARIPISYRTWEYSDSAVSVSVAQLIAPIAVSVPISPSLELLLSAAAQSGSVDAGETWKLTGAADTRAALVLSLMDRRLIIQSGLNIPTGVHELDTEQQIVAANLAPPFLSFRIRQPGRGLDLGAGASYAVPLSPAWSLGLGAGYVYRGRFRPVASGPEIRPGAETSLSAGLDGRVGALLLRVDATRRFYGRDDGDGTDYEEPAVWEGSLGGAANAGPWGLDAVVLLAKKEKSDTAPSFFSGTYLGGTLGLRRALGGRTALGIAGEIMRFKSEAAGTSGERFTSTTGGAGPLLALRLSGAVGAEAQLLRLTGDEDGRSIKGWDVRLTLTAKRPAALD